MRPINRKSTVLDSKVSFEAIPKIKESRTSRLLTRILQNGRKLTILNAICWANGFLIFGANEWMHTDPTSQDNLHNAITALTFICSIVFLAGPWGVWGARHLHHGMVFSYGVIIFLCSVAQLSFGVLFLTMTGKVIRNDTLVYVREASSKWVKFFRIQEQLNCCGATSYKNWIDTKWWKDERAKQSTLVIPESCCKVEGCNMGIPPFRDINDTSKVYTQGCVELVAERRNVQLWVTGSFALVCGSCSLCCFMLIHYYANVIVKLQQRLEIMRQEMYFG